MTTPRSHNNGDEQKPLLNQEQQNNNIEAYKKSLKFLETLILQKLKEKMPLYKDTQVSFLQTLITANAMLFNSLFNSFITWCKEHPSDEQKEEKVSIVNDSFSVEDLDSHKEDYANAIVTALLGTQKITDDMQIEELHTKISTALITERTKRITTIKEKLKANSGNQIDFNELDFTPLFGNTANGYFDHDAPYARLFSFLKEKINDENKENAIIAEVLCSTDESSIDKILINAINKELNQNNTIQNLEDLKNENDEDDVLSQLEQLKDGVTKISKAAQIQKIQDQIIELFTKNISFIEWVFHTTDKKNNAQIRGSKWEEKQKQMMFKKLREFINKINSLNQTEFLEASTKIIKVQNTNYSIKDLWQKLIDIQALPNDLSNLNEQKDGEIYQLYGNIFPPADIQDDQKQDEEAKSNLQLEQTKLASFSVKNADASIADDSLGKNQILRNTFDKDKMLKFYIYYPKNDGAVKGKILKQENHIDVTLTPLNEVNIPFKNKEWFFSPTTVSDTVLKSAFAAIINLLALSDDHNISLDTINRKETLLAFLIVKKALDIPFIHCHQFANKVAELEQTVADNWEINFEPQIKNISRELKYVLPPTQRQLDLGTGQANANTVTDDIDLTEEKSEKHTPTNRP